jgi:hypothetical protein
MGMTLYDALVLTKIAAAAPAAAPAPRKALTLGVPTLNFTPGQYRQAMAATPGLPPVPQPLHASFGDSRAFFAGLGFEMTALDVSDYEGADIVADLNDAGVADRLAARFDLIFDAGTVEHIFDASTAFRTINRLVKPGGVVMHNLPANGFMDHGLWQISPGLLWSFYQSAGFEVLTSTLLLMGPRPYAVPVGENFYRTKGRTFIAHHFPEALLVFAARKVTDTPHVTLQLQDHYAAMHQQGVDRGGMAFFLPFGSVFWGRLSYGPLGGILRLPESILTLAVRLKRRLFGRSGK